MYFQTLLTIVLLLLISFGCAPAQKSDHMSSSEETDSTYESRLDDVESNALFHFARGQLFLNEGNAQAAAEAFEKAIDADPTNQDLRFSLAELYIQIDQPDHAMRVIEDILIQNPDSVRAHLTLGNAFFSSQKPQEAIPHYQRVIELDPEREQTRIHLAIAFLRVGEFDKAVDTLKALLKLNPKSQPGRMALARVYRDTGLDLLAEEQYLFLIENFPEMGQAYLELGFLYEESQDWAEALKVFKMAQQHRPLDFALRHHVARIYVAQGEYDKALNELNVIIDLKPDDLDARRKVGLIYMEQSRWSEAAKVFEEILEIQPDLDQIRYYLGTVLEQQENWELALEAFRQIPISSKLYDDSISHITYILMETGRRAEAIDLLEEHLEQGASRAAIYSYLAALYLEDEESENALKVIRRGLQQFPEDLELLYQKGMIFERMGDHKQALQIMQNIVSIDPDNAEALNFIAYAYAEANENLDEALELIERAVAINRAPHILDTLGWVYYRLARYSEALEAILEANEQLPEDDVVLEHLGDVYRALKNYEAAADAYRKALEINPENPDIPVKLDALVPN